ncbi:hypothetical protein, partial [Enterobacter hormaechei]|uniref:hypothetical protein n=1 Tax=Enterobacter hormaechei TaxID=158836 RepID=UPI001BCF6303
RSLTTPGLVFVPLSCLALYFVPFSVFCLLRRGLSALVDCPCVVHRLICSLDRARTLQTVDVL